MKMLSIWQLLYDHTANVECIINMALEAMKLRFEESYKTSKIKLVSSIQHKSLALCGAVGPTAQVE